MTGSKNVFSPVANGTRSWQSRSRREKAGRTWDESRPFKTLHLLTMILVKLYRPHTTSLQKVAVWKGNGTPYFREIQVGEILFHLAR